MAILIDNHDVIVAQTARDVRLVPLELKIVPIVPVQPVLRSKPHEPTTVLHDTPHCGLGEPILNLQVLKFWVLSLALKYERSG